MYLSLLLEYLIQVCCTECRTFPVGNISPGIPPPGQFPSLLTWCRTFPPPPPPPCANLSKAIYHTWKLALNRIPNPNRLMTWGPDPNPNPNRPTWRRIIWKLTLTHIPDPNGYQSINVVHVNGRSLYIDWCMVVVVVGKCLTPCKKGWEIVRAAEMSRENMPEGEMSRRVLSWQINSAAAAATKETALAPFKLAHPV